MKYSDHAYEYNDIPDYSGYCPDCPECGEEMGYSYVLGEFKCKSCGYIMDEMDWDPKETGDIPWGCTVCGGPYPDCKAGCKVFDD